MSPRTRGRHRHAAEPAGVGGPKRQVPRSFQTPKSPRLYRRCDNSSPQYEMVSQFLAVAEARVPSPKPIAPRVAPRGAASPERVNRQTWHAGETRDGSDSARFRCPTSSKRQRVGNLRPDTLARAACLYFGGFPQSWRCPTRILTGLKTSLTRQLPYRKNGHVALSSLVWKLSQGKARADRRAPAGLELASRLHRHNHEGVQHAIRAPLPGGRRQPGDRVV